ncbi:YqiA/YcfP family alpha/beta fold hydrolase [Trichocoleus sp. FACHB-262]|uniref:YqiA/YcfP family alpha/beta fold hydrolase n=1 Tax=Trichocoleus sp. FACHB-262 TaxID=2692869 RepID=UPI0016861415|nr:YqiA/YcfP family alpha/beta fold hydrolase [Trichocoleus sp. FACHB-262]MBD2122942.1 alpha/beta fold hydrolase [Trichocoleus sp. FACHB-262]
MIAASPHYIYLHGFASSPRSTKAQDLRDRFQALGIELTIPDLNQPDFTDLTLTRQLQQVSGLLPADSTPVTLIGSSFGGLTAAWAAEGQPQIQRLVLLAPAFQFLDHWLPRLGEDQVQRWQAEQYLSVYHYGEERSLPLNYEFIRDAAQYPTAQLRRPIPTLVLHGRADDVIPIQASQQFAAQRSWVEIIELESDHALTNVSGQIWIAIQSFCQLKL